MQQIAFLGTGLMGFPMARNLAKANWSVVAWNRTAQKATGLAEFGCALAETPSQAVSDANIIITIVSDGSALLGLIDDLSTSLQPGSVWVDMSSTKASEAHTAHAQLSDIGVGFIDAPVSGGTKGADAATLAIMAGGEDAHYKAVEPALFAMGNPVHVGPPGAGQMCKLANQAIVGVTIGVVAEAQLFLERGGVDTDAMRKALKGGFADSTILQQHGSRMARRDFVPGGPSRLQLKDLRNVLDQAEALELSLPLVQAVEKRYARYLEELDGTERDHSGLFEELLDLQKPAKANT